MIRTGFEIIPLHQPPPIGIGSNWGWLTKMVSSFRLFDNYPRRDVASSDPSHGSEEIDTMYQCILHRIDLYESCRTAGQTCTVSNDQRNMDPSQINGTFDLGGMVLRNRSCRSIVSDEYHDRIGQHGGVDAFKAVDYSPYMEVHAFHHQIVHGNVINFRVGDHAIAIC